MKLYSSLSKPTDDLQAFVDAFNCFALLTEKQQKGRLTTEEDNLLNSQNKTSSLFDILNSDLKFGRNNKSTNKSFALTFYVRQNIRKLIKKYVPIIEITEQVIDTAIDILLKDSNGFLGDKCGLFHYHDFKTSLGTVRKTLFFNPEDASKDIKIYAKNSRLAFYNRLTCGGMVRLLHTMPYNDIVIELAKDLLHADVKNIDWDMLKYFPEIKRKIISEAEFALLSFMSDMRDENLIYQLYLNENPNCTYYRKLSR